MNEGKYVNGELIVAARMEDEEWYDDFQMLMEIGLLQTDKSQIIKDFLKEWEIIYGETFKDTKRLDMWADWISKVNAYCLESDEYERLSKLEMEKYESIL